MRMNRAWDSFWGALGFVRRNRRQRQAAARRRSVRRRHRFDSLEQRVVLNADPIAGDDLYEVASYVGLSTADYAPQLSNDVDPDGPSPAIAFNADPNRSVALNPGDSYSWEYLIGDVDGGFDHGEVRLTAPGSAQSTPFVYVQSTAYNESTGGYDVKVRLSRALIDQSVSVDWSLQAGTAQEGADYLGVYVEAYYSDEWISPYETQVWIDTSTYETQWVSNWVNYPQWVDDQYDEFGQLVTAGYWADNWVDEGAYQDVYVPSGYTQTEYHEGHWDYLFHPAEFTTSGVLTFATGETEKVLHIHVVDDGVMEGDESFTVQLSNAVGVDIQAWSHGTVTIIDNKAPTAGDDDFTMTLPYGTTVTQFDVGVFIPDLGNDFDGDGDEISLYSSSNPGFVNVEPGQTIEYAYTITDGRGRFGTATVRVHFVADLDPAPPPPPNHAPTFTPGGDLTVSAAQGFVVLSNWASEMFAGAAEEAGQALSFEIVIDDPAEQALFAESPQIEPNGALWFTTSGAAGTAHVKVRLRDDGGTENGGVDASDEFQFVIELSAPPSSGGGAAGDDPPVAVVGFDSSSQEVTVAEGSAPHKASFVITLSEPVDHQVSVSWHTAADTALPGDHFPLIGGIAVFAAGQTAVTVDVPIYDDGLVHGDRNFHVVLSNVIGGELDEDAQAEGVILEDDVSVTISDAYAAEAPDDGSGGPELVFTVWLSRACDYDVTVDYSTVDLTAASGADFESTSGTLTFAAGETIKEIRVRVVDDSDNSVDPQNSDYRRGENTEHVKVVLSGGDPHVMIERPYGVGTISDDDWQIFQVVDAENRSHYQRWYDPSEWLPGEIIDLDPYSQGFNSNLLQFEVPEEWQGAYFWDSYLDPIAEWTPSSPWEASQPTVTLAALDADAAGEYGKARFRFTVTGADNGEAVTINYATQGLTALADQDFVSVTDGTVTITGNGTSDVEIELTPDLLTEGLETLMLYVTSLVGAPLTTALLAIGQVKQPTVTSVKFLTSAESSATLGELSHDGNEFVKPGLWNYRYFPDAQIGETQGRNVVRVRAVVEGLKEGDRVYFRAYDVDDPSRADAADNTAPLGNDNFGRLDLTLDANGGITGDTHRLPGAPSDVDGFAGLMRGVGADGTAHVWRGYVGDNALEIPLVSGIVRRDFISGEYYAEAELLVSFQPGDNFRVVAMPQPVGDDPNWDIDDGQIPGAVVDAFDSLEFTNSKPNQQPQTHGMAATGLLTVWRYLHMEVDQMNPGAGEALGDKAVGTIAENLGMLGSHGWRFAIAVDPASTVHFNVDSLEGGILRVGGENFEIMASTPKVDGRVEVTVKRDIGRNLILEQFNLGNSVTLYEDDFKAPDNNPHGEPVLRLDLSNDLLLEATKYMKSSFRSDQNKFAEAFIMPEYEKLAQYSGDLAARNHWNDAWNDDDALTFSGTTGAQNGSRELGSDLFWTSYLGIAYQYEADRDFDADLLIGGRINETGDELPDTLGHPTSVQSFTTDGQGFRNSIVFAESIWDNWLAHRALDPEDPQYVQAKTWDAQLARLVIHEIATQFWVDHSAGIMDSYPTTVPEAHYSFISDDLKAFRLWPQPGQDYV